ncbi:MAG: hypothetical protein L0Z62_19820 [Gemmataceae bacterium]|nr:hypothetical protein [Gemmataceae bacterium]
MQRTFPPGHASRTLKRLMAVSALLGLALLLVNGASAGDDKKDKGKKPAAGGQQKIFYDFGPSMRFGLILVDPDGDKQKITYDPKGFTNFTFVSVDGKTYIFGAKEGDKLPPGIRGGRFDPMKAALGKGPDGQERRGHQSTWIAAEHIRITQTVEIVPSERGALDTVLVTYTVENKDEKPHKVAIRAMVDTFIGDNDGHPFMVPGKPKLITISADFKGKDVPPIVKALQNPDLKDPGLIATFSLRVGGGIDPPDRVSLTGFPTDNEDLLSWEIPIASIREAGKDGDAIAVMYWTARDLKGGARRAVGYAFGGGVVSLGKDGKKGEEKE